MMSRSSADGVAREKSVDGQTISRSFGESVLKRA
jgi:hypothetical protein